MLWALSPHLRFEALDTVSGGAGGSLISRSLLEMKKSEQFFPKTLRLCKHLGPRGTEGRHGRYSVLFFGFL